jgi:hypothetical protein
MYKHTNTKGQEYNLNNKEVTLRGGRKQVIYFFSKDIRDTACELPAGYNVMENARTGLPVCKKVR